MKLRPALSAKLRGGREDWCQYRVCVPVGCFLVTCGSEIWYLRRINCAPSALITNGATAVGFGILPSEVRQESAIPRSPAANVLAVLRVDT